MDTAASQSGSVKSFLIRHWRTILFVFSCFVTVLYFAALNWCYLLLNQGESVSRILQYSIEISGFGILVLLLPVSIAFFKPSLRLAERWLILFAFLTVFALTDVFGYHYPYVDRAYLDEPLKDFGESWSFFILAFSLFSGISMSLLSLFNRKYAADRPRWWRIVSAVLIWLILTVSWYLARLLAHT